MTLERTLSGSLRVQIVDHGFIDAVAAAEIVSMTLFDLAAQAVGEERGANGPVLIAGFADLEQAENARDLVLQRHADLVRETSVATVDANDWVESQRAGLEPTSVGPWHIRAPWHDEPAEVEAYFDIVIDPGVAFGHGAHPTTRVTIELMQRQLTGPLATERVVDLGTGTGVAAIIAARSGATVLAVENDAAACDIARQNIERNSMDPFGATADRIELVHGDAANVEVGPCDLAVANVTLDVQRLIAATCASADRIVVSGILCSQVRAMQDLYPTHVASTIRSTGEWVGIEFSSLSPRCRKKRNE